VAGERVALGESLAVSVFA
jgi:serine/threonine protein kinase